ncbi:MAG: ABC transporter ATP-binding protein [Chloroflexota bacterium]
MDLRVEGLMHVYPDGGVRALDGVDLAFRPGEVTALVGRNGSGKTTLARHVVGLLRPTAGRVLVDGADAAGLRVAALAARVGLAFQDPRRQLFARSVRDEVAFGPHNLGRRGAELAAAVERALAATGLAADAERHPYDLGGSRRKLLTIASVLAMDTPAVVLDEPTTGQDARGVARVGAIVDELAASGRTVLVISHDLRFVAEHAARVVVMEAGRVTLDGPPAEVFVEAAWPALAATWLEPPAAARVGARLGLGSTPTDGTVVAALVARERARG